MASRKELWALVEQGRQDPDAVRSRFVEMSEAELVDLYWTYQQVVADLKDESITAHLDPPLSEDGLDDIAHWVVGQGLDYYEDVMTEDGAMPRQVPSGEPCRTGTARSARCTTSVTACRCASRTIRRPPRRGDLRHNGGAAGACRDAACFRCMTAGWRGTAWSGD